MGSAPIVDNPRLSGLTGGEAQHGLPGTIVADDFYVKAAVDFRRNLVCSHLKIMPPFLDRYHPCPQGHTEASLALVAGGQTRYRVEERFVTRRFARAEFFPIAEAATTTRLEPAGWFGAAKVAVALIGFTRQDR
jgi:hypothetical protein